MSILDVVIRILLAGVLGGLIGIEREIREHTAGFRTHILVAVGAAAFTLASSYRLEGTDFDPNRISAQVVTGIGFLGAGAIIRYGVSVRGLTTAASLWTVAAVGLLAAQGFYSAALVTTAVVVVSLYVLRLIENRILYPRLGQAVGVRIHFRSPGFSSLAQLLGMLHAAHVIVKEMAVVPGEDDRDTIHLFLKMPRGLDRVKLTALIAELEEVRSVSVDQTTNIFSRTWQKYVPKEVLQRLRARAHRNHRSLQKQLLAIVETAAFGEAELTVDVLRQQVAASGLSTPDESAGWIRELRDGCQRCCGV